MCQNLKIALVILAAWLSEFQSSSQLIYDPTHIYDDANQFYHPNHIETIKIFFYQTNYHSTLKYWKENNIDAHLPAKLYYQGYVYDSVAVKYKGNSTFAVPNTFGNLKLPFNIDLNEYIPNQSHGRYRKFKLGNAWFDPTFAREVFASNIYKEYLPTYESNLVRLEVNGNYLGVYVNQEDVGKQFLKKHFSENDGAFFKCEPKTEEEAGHPVDWPDLLWRGNDTLQYFESYERKSPTGWDEFLNMIYTLNYDVSNIENVINVDRVLWNFAVTTVLSNEDTYNTTIIHNYYMYQTADGKFQMMPWDLTETFCGILFTGGNPEDHYELDPLYGLQPYFANRPLVYQLLSIPYYRKKYFAHIRTIIDEFYNVPFIQLWIQNLQGIAYNAVNSDPNKPHDMTKFQNNVFNEVNYLLIYKIAGIIDVVNNRKNFFDTYLDLQTAPPLIDDVEQSLDNPSSSDTVYVYATVSNATNVFLRTTNNNAPYASDYLSITMNDNGIQGDEFSGDGIYTAAIPFHTSNDHVKYYIEAENNNAMKLSPQRAEYFYYHYYIDQVVTLPDNELVDIKVYPNPTADVLNIELNTNEDYELIIFDINGKTVFSEKGLSEKTTLDLSFLQAGNYLVQIKGASFEKTKKISVL